jgi:MFS family permease
MKSQDLKALYLGSSLMGLFCSGIYPLTMNLPNSLSMKTSTRNTSKYALGGSMGETILPFLAGTAMAHFGQNSLFIWELVLVILLIGVYKYSLDIANKTTTDQTGIELTLTKGDLYRQLED